MFDKVNMTITCTTETRERPAEQPGQAARRQAAGRHASRQPPVKLVLGRTAVGAARDTPEPLRWPPPLPRV